MEAEQYFTRSTRKFKEKDSYAMLRSGLQTKSELTYSQQSKNSKTVDPDMIIP